MVRDADLAEVVEGRVEEDPLDPLVVVAALGGDLLGDDPRVARHALEVRAGLEVPQLREVPRQLHRVDDCPHRHHLVLDGEGQQVRHQGQLAVGARC